MFYVLGLDLGKWRDYTALCFLAGEERLGGNRYEIQAIERMTQGWTYKRQIARVREQLEKAIAQDPAVAGCALVIDETGVGAAVVEDFVHSDLPCAIHPVMITPGRGNATHDELHYRYHVPKYQLASTMSVLLEGNGLVMPPGLKYQETLFNELRAFTEKITQFGNQVYEAARESDHDDLTLALALAAWFGENVLGFRMAAKAGPPGPMSTMLAERFPERDDADGPAWRYHGGKWPPGRGPSFLEP